MKEEGGEDVKKSRNRENRTKTPVRVPVGAPLGIHDCEGRELCMGDHILFLPTTYYGERDGVIDGIEARRVTVAMPRFETRYLPLDDGARMRVRRIE